jgi:hypothetical protein
MKRNLLKPICVAALVVVGAVLPAQAAVLGPGGHYYDVIYASGISWPAADAAASAMTFHGAQGYLATVTSAAEDAFLNGAIAPTQREFWAGGFQNPITETVATAGWTWVNGEGAFGAYQPWAGGEPNDAYGPASEQYLGLGWTGGNGGWNDEGALGNIGGFLVEFNGTAAPEGAAGLAGILAIVGLFAAHRRTRKA